MGENELFPIVDKNGVVIGCATRKECHSGSKLLHPVVHLHVFNAKGQLFLQHRSMEKDIQPGKWDTSVGGHVDFGESVEAALRREACEELGLHLNQAEKLYDYIFESEIERELVNTYRTVCECTNIEIDGCEITEGRFFSIDEIKRNIGKGIFTPNFELEFEKMQQLNLLCEQ